jgi:hypothetical protein
MIFVAIAAQDVVSWLRERTPVWRRCAAVALALYAAAHLYMSCNRCFRSTPVYHFYDVAKWVEQNTDRGETIGVFQSGAIGYVSNRRVVNLDGKVNGQALTALQDGTLDNYIRRAGIDVLMDDTEVIRLFLGDEHSFDDGECFTGDACGLPGWIGYRLRRDGAERASAHPGEAKRLH